MQGNIAVRLVYLSGCLSALAALVSCQVDPEDLADTTVPITAKYRAGAKDRPLLSPGDWWKCFRDPVLNNLLARVDEKNPTLASDLARYDQARAALGLAKADRSPATSGDLIWKRKRDSSSGVFVPPEVNYSEYRAALNLTWEIDLWGRVRQSVNAARDDMEAAAADYAAARLSLQAETARTYFQIRYIDAERDILGRSVGLRQENVRLIRARVEGGEVTDFDLARAETELESVRAQIFQLERSRREFLNALAILVGQSPAGFSLERHSLKSPPSIPSGVPSELLLRRPDVYAAERRIEAAAARVGVVKASYLPRITLAATGGLSTLDLDTLLDPSSLFGEVGPDIAIPLYQAGRAGRDKERAEAEAREIISDYRATVLQAFREVEDSLAGAFFLDQEISANRRGSSAASRAADLSQTRYEGGLVSFLEVIDAQRTALDEERKLIQAESARHLATVQLVQALGGGWDAPEKSTRKGRNAGGRDDSSREYAQGDP